MKLKYFMVSAKCGHVGKSNYIRIDFAVKALSGKEAAARVRSIPRVKHDHKDAILWVQEISYEEFVELLEINNNDPYLKCESRHEQNKIPNLKERMIHDTHVDKPSFNGKKRSERVEATLSMYEILEREAKEEISLGLIEGLNDELNILAM